MRISHLLTSLTVIFNKLALVFSRIPDHFFFAAILLSLWNFNTASDILLDPKKNSCYVMLPSRKKMTILCLVNYARESCMFCVFVLTLICCIALMSLVLRLCRKLRMVFPHVLSTGSPQIFCTGIIC